MQGQDTAMFDSVYVNYSVILRRMAMRYNIPAADAEDLVQEVFICYFKAYPIDWDAIEMKRMLVRILKNKCIDYSRKRRLDCISLNAEGTEWITTSLQVHEDGLTSMIKREERLRFCAVLNNMRSDWRDVFMLYFIQGRPLVEVSELLGISKNACRTRISRGRKYLKDAMHEEH